MQIYSIQGGDSVWKVIFTQMTKKIAGVNLLLKILSRSGYYKKIAYLFFCHLCIELNTYRLSVLC